MLNTDGPVTMPWLSSVRAVLQTWYGGRGMGTALAAILFGDSDPAGRLPVTFAVGELDATYNASTRALTATVTITNTGSRTGWQTVQLYATLPAAADAEVRRLVGFAKVNLTPGGRTRLTITVSAHALSIWNSASSAWVLPRGTYTLWAGTSSRSLPAQRRFTLTA